MTLLQYALIKFGNRILNVAIKCEKESKIFKIYISLNV